MRRLSTLKAPSPSMFVAVLALVVALTGVATALPGKRSVKADDIATNAVTKRAIKAGAARKPEVAKNAVGNSEIVDGSVRSIEVADDTISGGDIDESSLGAVPSATNVEPNGVETGDIQDDAVTAGKLGIVTRESASVTLPDSGANGGTASQFVNCGVGKETLGGGATISGGVTAAEVQNLHIHTSRPFLTAAGGWTARAWNNTGTNRTLTVYALCLQ
jgi:hypothetical protein